MIADVGAVVPSDPGDPLLSTWTLWWNAQVVPFSARWWDGLAFFPARDTLTFSDHRVGLGLVASPVLWLGGSAVAAYNITFVATFLLSALAGYALGFTLTGSRAAAFVAGLIFGFHPFRAEHLPHLELLASFWLPVVLHALHQWTENPRGRWLAVAAGALTMQALTCGYYFVFFAPLLGLWLVWFTPRRLPLKQYAALASALAMPVLIMAPVLLRYRSAHHQYGFARSINEIEQLSADLIGLITAPEPLAFWNTPDAWRGPEGSLLPGITAVALVAAAAVVRRRQSDTRSSRPWVITRRILLGGALTALGAALIPRLWGPVAFELAGLRVSVSNSYKPFSTAVVFLTAWILSSAGLRQAWSQRSAFPFYVLATLVMWLFALGPTARLFGERILYKPPYSWLMLFPGFRDGFRSPSRFAMMAALTLSVAAALAFARLSGGRRTALQMTMLTVVAAGVLLDSWIAPFRVVPAPPALTVPAEVPADAAILELPIGVFEDAATMYHSIFHGRRMLNGMSGYEAPHYPMLRLALEEGRAEVLKEFAAHAPLAVFVPRDGNEPKLSSLIQAKTPARPIAVTATHTVLLLDRQLETAIAFQLAFSVRALSFASDLNPQHLAFMNDDDRLSTWVTPKSQSGGEQFIADLGSTMSISGISLSLGKSMTAFPRGLVIELSPDGSIWTEMWRGDTAAMSVAAAISDPRDIATFFPFPSQSARFVRVTQTGHSTEHPWAVAEFRAAAGAQ